MPCHAEPPCHAPACRSRFCMLLCPLCLTFNDICRLQDNCFSSVSYRATSLPSYCCCLVLFHLFAQSFLIDIILQYNASVKHERAFELLPTATLVL
jgi:hypothetical protein